MANTTWNPADLSNVTLTGSNLIATVGSGSGGARGVDSKTSGKYYWEYTYTTINTNSLVTGISLISGSLTSPGTGVAYVARVNGNIFVNASYSGSTLGIIAPSSILGVAVDFSGSLLWVRLAPSGNWNGSGTANPGTGAGGLSISSITTAALYPLMSGQSGDKITANFGDTAFSGAVPSGFTAGFPAVTAQARVAVLA